MKKLALITAALATTSLFAASGFEKEGFLTTENCAKQGAFKDCYMENYVCGSDGCYRQTEAGVDKKTPLVLYSHDDGIIYKLDIGNVPRETFDAGISRNAVSIVGEFDASTNTIVVQEFKAPPPPKKSFFKGCL
jgi:hypothetical protein